MTPPLRPDRRLYTQGDRKTVRGEDLMGESLRAGNRITVFQKQLADDKKGWWGHGGRKDEPGRTSFIKGDIVNVATGAPIEGDLYVVITDSDGDPLARRTLTDLEDLREAAAEARTDRPAMPAMSANGKAARPNRNLELQIEAAESSDGDEVDPVASTLKAFYSTDDI